VNELHQLIVPFSNLDKKAGVGSGVSVAGELLLAALGTAGRKACFSSLVLGFKALIE